MEGTHNKYSTLLQKQDAAVQASTSEVAKALIQQTKNVASNGAMIYHTDVLDNLKSKNEESGESIMLKNLGIAKKQSE